ncbi:uncharacterized protein LOC110893061 [Helianthus annuus]|uniref:uncharacterized protein LOC110893061 n=1 Tax=Helianthus annuus TaxID=4232 RepID=UPI000B90495E|nr:uncharacterized protein LOC110893061 [Helianthus annuus]
MNPEAVANNRASKTRLQKQAPATLHLHQFPSKEPQEDMSKTVIPLLSPVVLSPASLPEAGNHMGYSFPTPDNGEVKRTHEIAIGKNPQVQQNSSGDVSQWQHPAMSMMDTTSLYSCFESKCTIRPRNQ